ncbi:NADH dehydrogenase [ubiquinone] 1 alpha subcomplex subunit [Arachis hypogaea]|nr:NADH dehydrogenase [ubiquinone] 1 alpha subcomplex subunit [Arachis hypogaea]
MRVDSGDGGGCSSLGLEEDWKEIRVEAKTEASPESAHGFRVHHLAASYANTLFDFGIIFRESMAWRGNLSKNIRELRFLMCQSSPASSSARTFVEKNYKELKTLNPKLPILIRECSGAEPQLWARFDFGVEKGIKLEGLSEAQISKALEDLVKAGEILKA